MLDSWQLSFPNCEPVAHLLRVAFADRWIRFHTLPEARRVPQSEEDYATLLGRYNRVLDELTQTNPRIVMLTTDYSISPKPERSQTEWDLVGPAAAPWRSIEMSPFGQSAPDDPRYWHVFARELEWQSETINPIFRLIADNKVANVMFVAPDCRWLLHPYDGGMDLILETTATRDDFASHYPEWRSKRSDGL